MYFLVSRWILKLEHEKVEGNWKYCVFDIKRDSSIYIFLELK